MAIIQLTEETLRLTLSRGKELCTEGSSVTGVKAEHVHRCRAVGILLEERRFFSSVTPFSVDGRVPAWCKRQDVRGLMRENVHIGSIWEFIY